MPGIISHSMKSSVRLLASKGGPWALRYHQTGLALVRHGLAVEATHGRFALTKAGLEYSLTGELPKGHNMGLFKPDKGVYLSSEEARTVLKALRVGALQNENMYGGRCQKLARSIERLLGSNLNDT